MSTSKPWRESEVLERLYVDQSLTQSEVADELGCSKTTVGDWLHRLGVGGKECPHCGNSYKRLGKHWTENPAHTPNLTQKQHSIITGVLMGDGSIGRDDNNPRLVVKMVNKTYLEHLSKILYPFTIGVSLDETASESAKRSRDRGFSEIAKEENYSDLYNLRTHRSEVFQRYADWYGEGGKVWPKSTVLTPETLKHWYVCDGSLQKSESPFGFRMTIALANESGNKEKVKSMFTKSGIPEPCNWDERAREDGRVDVNIYWTNGQSRDLFQYMGDPPLGFERKWPKEGYL